MDDFIQISKLNDFLYSPKSLYFHSAYEDFDVSIYHDTPQTAGNIAHASIDDSTYSSAKRYLQGFSVYSEIYKLIGKIDIYDQKDHKLIERKNKIKIIHKGYKYQLYAQFFCLCEMGFEVKSLWLHSLQDNKRYQIDLPNKTEVKEFEELLKKIRHFDVVKNSHIWSVDEKKDPNTIYNELYF